MLPPDPQTVGLYITACAAGSDGITASRDNRRSQVEFGQTIERRLSALTWNYARRGTTLDRKDRHVATVLAAIRNTHATQPRQKEAALPEHLIAMLETLPRGTFWGLRDRAMLLIGFAGGLRRSEIVGLDVGRDQTKESRGWVEILDKGMVVTVRGKRGWRSGNRPRLVGRHLPDRDAADLAQPCEDRARPPVPAGDRSRQGCWPRTAAGSGSGAPLSLIHI